MILEYILKYHLQDCVRILAEEDNLGYFCINIDFLKLFETSPDVGDQVLCNPVDCLPTCSKDILKAQQNIIEQDEYKDQISSIPYCYLKRNVQARFFGLPVCPELHRTVFPKNVDLGCFLKVTGTVVRVTQAKMLEYQRKYVCMKCKYENIVEAHFENRYILKAPTKCGNDDTRCRCATFSQVPLVSREHCKDYQEIKIQEQVNKLSIGTIPGSMWVVLENDLVDSCKPGDDVNICGTVRRRWRPTSQNKKAEVELVLQANYVEVCNSQRSDVVSSAPDVKECFTEFWSRFEACPLKGRDQILASVCPQVYGLHLVKLAVLLTVITGSNHKAESEEKKSSDDDKHTTRVRGQCHLLLVGDPGTGKSQLLRAGAELTARSVFTSGAGSTRAGLTCAALREEGEWQLEAGALVLSDGGVCCIDEISHLREHDRTAIHEAMEQQTISIAKAGIVCKLNTRCAVIAACNPKGHYQTDEPLAANVSLGTPLLKMERRTPSRVSEAQWGILMEFLESNPNLARARGYNNSARGRAESLRLWQEVANLLNAEGSGTTKSPKEWSVYVSNYKSKLKKIVADINTDANATGGGPPQASQNLTDWEMRFLALLGPGFGQTAPRVMVLPIHDEQPSTSAGAAESQEVLLEIEDNIQFDLIFILLDAKNKSWDKLVASYILFGGSNTESKKQWSLEKLQMYISLVGPRATNMTKSANVILRAYYMMQRKAEYRDSSRTTVRMLDSLVRLSQAHCRLMYRTTILPMDAVVAISLVDLSMQDCTLNDTVDALHSTFQKYPDFEYLSTAKKLLTRLNLYDIWQNELLYYGKLLQVDHKTLENSIDKGDDYHLFAKYDDVTDDNIQLSAAVVTSTYFKNKNNENSGEVNEFKNNVKNQINVKNSRVSEKLTATLKKHSTLNKQENKPPNNQNKHNVSARKRKVVTVDVKPLKESKKIKKTNSKHKEMDSSDDSCDNSETANALNAVPSVNDIFTELGIDFKFEGSDNKESSSMDLTNENVVGDNKSSSKSHQVEIKKNDTYVESNKLTKSEVNANDKTKDKLRRFMFVEKQDFDKFYEARDENLPPKPKNVTVVKLEHVGSNTSNASQLKSSLPSSQISIFESSVCDIDLDII